MNVSEHLSRRPKLTAGATAATGSAGLYGILREIDSRWIPYIAVGAFLLVSLLATYLFLLLRERRMAPRYNPDEPGPPRRPSRYPDTMYGAHFAALDAARNREVVNFIAGTTIALAGTALALYVAATRAGLAAPIFVGTLTALLAGFYFFSYCSMELHRRRIESHNAHVLAVWEFTRILSDRLPEPDYTRTREEILATIAALAPVPETTRAGGLRRKDLKAAIDMIQAAGSKIDSGPRSD